MFGSKRAVLHFLIFMLVILAGDSMAAKIVVVGSGLAGFSAAARLMENDINDIVILEVEDRIGGRIKSVPYGSGFIDMGAQWCHGSGKNVIYSLASPNFTFGDTGVDDYPATFHTSDGSLVNKKQCSRLISLCESILEDCESMENFNSSIGDFFVSRYKKAVKTVAYNDIPSALTNQMLDFHQKEVLADFGAPTWFDLSAKLDAASTSTTGSQYLTWGTKGFKTVFSFISKKAVNSSDYLKVTSKVVFKKEVTNINWGGSVMTVACKDGTNYTADHVIFTPSLGVLKERHQSLFTPDLPAKKVNAIMNTGFGNLGKIFLEFSPPFWSHDPEEFISYAFLWTDEDLKSLIESDKAWLADLNSFTRVDGFPNLLEGLLSGRGVSLFEKHSDSKVINDCMWLLQKFLKKTLPSPKKMFRSKWQSDRNYLGSYSYRSMAMETAKVGKADLSKTLTKTGENFLFFAGEATDLVFPSYAHGAVQSGWRAADKIVKFINDEVAPF